VGPAISFLRDSDVKGARVFGEALDDFRGARIAFKTYNMIRAYLQNSYLLSKHGFSYREFLRSIAGGGEFPPKSVAGVERKWVRETDIHFFNVGEALANYMVCDWLLWLWREGRIDWFESYKADSVHLKAVDLKLLPEEARAGFVAYCRTIPMPGDFGPVAGKPCPPRVLNECIWLDGAATASLQGKSCRERLGSGWAGW